MFLLLSGSGIPDPDPQCGKKLDLGSAFDRCRCVTPRKVTGTYGTYLKDYSDNIIADVALSRKLLSEKEI